MDTYIPEQRYPWPTTLKTRDTDRIIRELATLKGKPILDCIREACEHEIQRERLKTPLWEVQPLLDRIAPALPKPA
ncbi:hypothetical protein [Bradyrhizobium elkanii]|uniref:hypothetical protein n=1 Tax=Bradyrhizobium elkanii TaxID=29448 RepID=UPI003515ED5E